MPPENKKLTIDLLRHGEPVGGEVLRGRVDHELSELGWQQMQNATNLVRPNTDAHKNVCWTHLVSSPLKRCRAFAEQLAQEQNLSLQIESDWQEIDYGDWDGLPLTTWREKSAAQFREFRQDESKLAPPNGEAFVSFKDRVLRVWQDLSELPEDSHVLVITHGGVLRVVLPTVLGMPLNRSQPLHIPFASFSRIELTVTESKITPSLIFHHTTA